jgi:NADPH2:quinone reductase|tara:strand:- start:65 stop:1093 length:1029 start_codon:yes stop_codon:yes gene_type:complete
MTHASKLFALLCTAYGAPPHIETVALPTPAPIGKDEVRLQIHHAAFNFTDHLLVQGRYQDKPNPPFIPGLDAAGIVLETGPGVTQFQAGDLVVSSGVVGAWASQLTAPAHRLVHIPNGLNAAHAVASINSHLTAYHGLIDRAQLKAGERVLVLGANGAVGKACVQIAEHFGANVVTVERRNANQLIIKDRSNPTNTAIVKSSELKTGIRTIVGQKGANIVVDPVGDFYTEAAVRNLAWRGRLLVVGFAAGDIPKISTNLLLLKGAALVGVYCGGLLFQETPSFTHQMANMFQLMADGVLSPLPYESMPAHNFPPIWSRFSSAPKGSKLLLDFQTNEGYANEQ